MSDDPTRIIRRRRDGDNDPEKTRIIRHGDEEADPLSEIVSRPGGKGSRGAGNRGSDEDPTRLYGGGTDEEAPTRLAGAAPPADDQTRVHRRPKQVETSASSPEAAVSAPSSAETENAAAEPTVGWLVVVEGPGKGHSLVLSYGKNSIGRSGENRVALAFGDDEVSKTKHAVLSYDPRGRKFYVSADGDGVNMTYLDDVPLLGPQSLQGGEQIRLGQTVLQFVPFCGEHFDWD